MPLAAPAAVAVASAADAPSRASVSAEPTGAELPQAAPFGAAYSSLSLPTPLASALALASAAALALAAATLPVAAATAA